MEIEIDPGTGWLRCMFSEEVGAHLRGSILAARKVSRVAFNAASQEWVAVDLQTGAIVASDATRAGCVRAEHDYYERMILEGESPWKKGGF